MAWEDDRVPVIRQEDPRSEQEATLRAGRVERPRQAGKIRLLQVLQGGKQFDRDEEEAVGEEGPAQTRHGASLHIPPPNHKPQTPNAGLRYRLHTCGTRGLIFLLTSAGQLVRIVA